MRSERPRLEERAEPPPAAGALQQTDSRAASVSPAIARLLVSVRSADEVAAALDGGCDILDIKEPNRGSLGMSDLNVVTEIVQAVNTESNRREIVPVSAALGELIDWPDDAPFPALPAQLSYVKLGLAGIGDDAGWISRWQRLRQKFEDGAAVPFQWIAVAYADWQPACAPQPADVVQAAAATGCRGVLFDTFSKNGETLLDCIPENELARLSAAIRRQGMLTALAGGLRTDSLPALASVVADVVGIRTAACRNGSRTGAISTEAVRAFKRSMIDSRRPAERT